MRSARPDRVFAPPQRLRKPLNITSYSPSEQSPPGLYECALGVRKEGLDVNPRKDLPFCYLSLGSKDLSSVVTPTPYVNPGADLCWHSSNACRLKRKRRDYDLVQQKLLTYTNQILMAVLWLLMG